MQPLNDNAPVCADPHTTNSTDVRYYVSILRGWWREIVLAVLLAALAGGALQSWQQPVYEAAADVAIGHARPLQVPQVIVLEKGPSDDKIASSAALLGLVHQGEVARIVRERLGERLPGVSAVGLLELIAGDFVTYRGRALSDLIRISARASTPQDAADLATIWAEEYVASVNRMQRLEKGGGAIDALQTELASALQAGEQSQRRLEAFVAEDDAAALRRELRANESALERLWAVGGNDPDAASARAAIAELEAENRALGTRIEAAGNALRLLTAERDAAYSLVRSLRDEIARRKVDVAAAAPRVHLASAALAPAAPASRSPRSAAAIAGLAALPTAVLLAWFAHAMGVTPLIASVRLRRRR